MLGVICILIINNFEDTVCVRSIGLYTGCDGNAFRHLRLHSGKSVIAGAENHLGVRNSGDGRQNKMCGSRSDSLPKTLPARGSLA